MQSTVFKQRFFAALTGVALVVPVAFSFAAQPSGKSKNVAETVRASALEEMAMSGDLVESWGEYAMSSLKSNFAWAREPGEAVAEPPTIFTRSRSSWARTPASRFPGTSVEDAKPFQVAMQSSRVSESPIYTAAADAGSLLPDQAPGLRRTIVAPSFTQRLENYGYWRISLILAYQKFSLFAPLQGSQSAFDRNGWAWADNASALRHQENSVGFGTRLDMSGRLVQNLDWRAGYQSRVGMDNFYTYRGIFGEAGSFDIPPSTNFGLDWSPVRSFRVSVDYEYVMYSHVAPFASYSLPSIAQHYMYLADRPLAWKNLDIYSVGAAWRNGSLGEFAVRYSTREQPLPNLRVLQRYLEQQGLASHDWEFDYARAFGERTMFRFRAVYAPLQLLGIPNYTADGNLGANRMRYEALLTTAF